MAIAGTHTLAGDTNQVGVFCKVTIVSAAEIVALTTPVEIAPDPGDGYALEFLGAVLNIYGGTTDYQTSHNLDVSYTDGDGTTVSTTLADFLTGTKGAIKTLKAITTDVALTASAKLVLVSSANPTVGDRLLQVRCYYRIHTVDSSGT